MAALVHNLGLELPIFDEGTPVAWTHQEISMAGSSEATSFIRRASLEDTYSTSFAEALKLGSLVLEQAADYFDAQLIKYSWGLIKGRYCNDVPFHKYNSSAHHLVPYGYSLVAEVATAPNALQPRAQALTELLRTSDRYFSDMQAGASSQNRPVHIIRDMKPDHFVLDQDLLLVDIEPRIKRLWP